MSLEYLKLPVGHYFDHAFLVDTLKDYRAAQDKITLMLKHGEIIRIRNGLYIRSNLFGGLTEPVEIANAIYGPSYISLEYALSYYGMIPERVETITSVTPKRSKLFTTPVASFSYTHIQTNAYGVGVEIQKRGPSGILMATREKAVCDKLAQAAHVRTIKGVAEFLIEDQRIDPKDLANLSLDLLDEIENAYSQRRITIFTRWVRKNSAGKGPLA